MPQVNSQLQVYYGWNLNYSLHQYRSLLNKILARSIRFQVSYHLHLWSQHSSLAADLHLATVNHASHRRSHTMLCLQKGTGGGGGGYITRRGQTDSVWAFFCPTSYGANILPGSVDSSKVFETSFIHCQRNMMSIVLWGDALGGWGQIFHFCYQHHLFSECLLSWTMQEISLSASWVEQCRKSLWVVHSSELFK